MKQDGSILNAWLNSFFLLFLGSGLELNIAHRRWETSSFSRAPVHTVVQLIERVRGANIGICEKFDFVGKDLLARRPVDCYGYFF
jgi:hypothetical protein